MRGQLFRGSGPLADVLTSAVPPADPPAGDRRLLTRPTGRRGRVDGRTAGLIVLLLVSIWLVAVFGRALAEANTLAERQAQEQQINDQLRARVNAGRAEISYIQTAPFLHFESRAYGMGGPGEHAFALATDAPPPPSLTPLGGDPTPSVPSTPLDDWIALLLGH